MFSFFFSLNGQMIKSLICCLVFCNILQRKSLVLYTSSKSPIYIFLSAEVVIQSMNRIGLKLVFNHHAYLHKRCSFRQRNVLWQCFNFLCRLLQMVRDENLKFMKNRDVYSSDYFSFVLSLASLNAVSTQILILEYSEYVVQKWPQKLFGSEAGKLEEKG